MPKLFLGEYFSTFGEYLFYVDVDNCICIWACTDLWVSQYLLLGVCIFGGVVVWCADGCNCVVGNYISIG